MITETILASFWPLFGSIGWAALLVTILVMGWYRHKGSKEFQKAVNKEGEEIIPERRLIYIDSAKRKWYAFKEGMRLPSRRLLASEMALKQAEMNITPDILLTWIDRMASHMNEGNLQKLGFELGRLRERLDFAGEEKTLLNVSNVYFMVEGEDPAKITSEYTEIKRQIWENDPACRDFFLVCAFRIINNASESSKADILEYLKEVKSKLR